MEQKLKCDVYIGKNLRRLREKFGLSQEKLCAELQCRNCDIGRSTYAKYENGELNIRISVLMELKKIYNCSQWKQSVFHSSACKHFRPYQAVR